MNHSLLIKWFLAPVSITLRKLNWDDITSIEGKPCTVIAAKRAIQYSRGAWTFQSRFPGNPEPEELRQGQLGALKQGLEIQHLLPFSCGFETSPNVFHKGTVPITELRELFSDMPFIQWNDIGTGCEHSISPQMLEDALLTSRTAWDIYTFELIYATIYKRLFLAGVNVTKAPNPTLTEGKQFSSLVESYSKPPDSPTLISFLTQQFLSLESYDQGANPLSQGTKGFNWMQTGEVYDHVKKRVDSYHFTSSDGLTVKIGINSPAEGTHVLTLVSIHGLIQSTKPPVACIPLASESFI